MGTKNNLTKRFIADNEVFADAFNYLLYDGKQVIRPDELTELDSTENAVFRKNGKMITNEKMRDVLKQCVIKQSARETLVLFGIEAQANIHYAMPVRNYLYDALNYEAQVKNIEKTHREEKDLTGDEMISGFSKTDRISPVITLCICFAREKWDAPRSLFDMFGDIDPEILKYVNDYKLNLITTEDIEDFDKFSSDLGIVMETIKYADDMDKVRDIITGEEELKVLTADMMNTYAGTKIPTENTKGDRIMVGIGAGNGKGWQDWMKELRKEGLAEGEERLLIEQVCKKLAKGKSLEIIADEVEESTERVKAIADVAEGFAPDYDVDLIFTHFSKIEK